MAGILKVDRIQEANSGQGVELSHKLVDTSGNTIISENSNGVATFGASVAPSTNYTFRNKIINGNLKSARVINQRGATSIAPSGSTGYTYDRWYFDGSTYLYQGIEDKNVNNGTYVISWEGSGINAAWKVSTDTTANNGPDATTGFTSVSNGGTFTVNEGTEYSKHLWIRFDGTLANLDKVQVEEGTVATPFEHRPYGTELSLAQRYYYRVSANVAGNYLCNSGFGINTTKIFAVNHFPVQLRTKPTALEQSGTASDYVVIRAGNSTFAGCSAVPTFDNSSQTFAVSTFTVTSGIQSGYAGNVYGNNTNAYLAWSVEL